MEKRISPADEKRLTGAIEKAATLASADDSRDRDQLLADCLLENDIDSRFAKVASAAFNKRLTVLTFQHTPDEQRTASFALADADTVHQLMGGTAQVKTAACGSMFCMELTATTADGITKSASVAVYNKPLYESRVFMPDFERHAISVMQKQAAAHTRLMGELNKVRTSVEQQRAELAKELRKTASFTVQTLINVYGDEMKVVLKDSMPECPFTKTAGAINPNTELSHKVARLIEDSKHYTNLHNAIAEYQDGLEEFSKSASEFADEFRKTAYISAAAGALMRGVGGAGATALQAVDSVRKATTDAAGKGFENAISMYNAGQDRGVSPSKVLDAEFLTKDRFRDRMLGWSDMTADPLFAMYPAEQVFYATQKAMDLDPSLERADKREVLRAQVGQLLAQNNRSSMADISALSSTLKALKEAPTTAAREAAAVVEALNTVDAPEAPALNNILDMMNPDLGEHKDYIAWAAEGTRKDFAEAKSDAKEEAKSKKEEQKTRQEAQQKALQAAQKAQQDAQQALRDAFVKVTQLRPDTTPGNRNRYIMNGRSVSQKQVEATFANWVQAQQNMQAMLNP